MVLITRPKGFTFTPVHIDLFLSCIYARGDFSVYFQCDHISLIRLDKGWQLNTKCRLDDRPLYDISGYIFLSSWRFLKYIHCPCECRKIENPEQLYSSYAVCCKINWTTRHIRFVVKQTNLLLDKMMNYEQ